MVLVQFETRSKIGYWLYVAVNILLFMTEVDFIAILKLQMYIANLNNKRLFYDNTNL
jgi:hypothetical protein